MKFFRIAKWEKYQHYHKPRPPWLKIYTSINDINTDWRPLKDAQVGQLMRMMAYAALNDNAMPYEDELMQELLGLDEKLDLSAFKKVGVITVFKDRSSCLSREKSRIKSRQNPIAPSSEVRDQRVEDRDQRKEEKNAPPEMMEVTTDDGKRIQELTRRFVQLRLENDPGAKIPGILMAWDAEMARIHIADKRPYDQIQEVIDHSMADEFWRVNILTPHDLRQKFPKLVLNLKRGTGKKSGFAGPDNRAERNIEAMNSVLKEISDAEDNQSIDSNGSDTQRTDEPGKAVRVFDDPERLS